MGLSISESLMPGLPISDTIFILEKKMEKNQFKMEN